MTSTPLPSSATAGDAAPAQRDGAIPPAVRVFTATLVAAMVGLLAAVQAVVPLDAVPWVDVAVIVALAAVSYIDAAHLFFGDQRHRISFSFNEVAVVAALVFLPGIAAPLAMAAGSAIYQLAARRGGLLKFAFNTAQDTVGVSVAVLVLASLPSLGTPANGVSLLSVAMATFAYVAVSTAVHGVLLSLLLGPGGWQAPLSRSPIDAVAMLGSISVAMIAIHLWLTEPVLIVFAAVPLVTVAMAYRATLRSQDLARERTADAERLQRLVASATDGILLLDGDGVVRVWNPVLRALTGLGAEDAEGGPLSAAMAGVTREADAPLGSRPRTVATWGEGRVMEEYTSEVEADGPGRAGRVIVLRDITRQQEADDLKQDFVARVSHELRTPLTPLTGFIELLRGRPQRFDPEAHAEVLDAMARNAERLSALVDELLVVVELDRGPMPPGPGRVDVARAATSACDQLRIDPGGHVLRVDIPAGTIAAGDPGRLTSVLSALVDNAVRYSPWGTTVEVTTVRDGDTVVVRVRDEGPGIPPSAHELVFERFSRLEDPLRMRTGGLGLGLFVARRLAESMDATLTIAATGLGGTTMEVRLPALGPDLG